jgi:hypothetical protein
VVPTHAVVQRASRAPASRAGAARSRAAGGPSGPASGGASTAERVLELQRAAGNAAVTTLLGVQREADPYTASVGLQATQVADALERLRDVDTQSTPDQDTSDRIDAAFRPLAGLSMQNMLDVLAVVKQRGAIAVAVELLPKAHLGDAVGNRIGAAIDAVARNTDLGDASQLPGGQQAVLATFGPARPGTSGDDPDGNTYVVYDGYLRTYFMSGVEKARRSSSWLAHNPGNSDRIGSMGIGPGMKWGAHTFAVFSTLKAGRANLWQTMQTRETLGGYLGYHLGKQKDGSYADGNDPATYLEHIRKKAPWAQMDTRMAWVKEQGKQEELLDGFQLAEGGQPGNEIHASSATITASMSPAQQKTMRFYLRLLGIRAADEA